MGLRPGLLVSAVISAPQHNVRRKLLSSSENIASTLPNNTKEKTIETHNNLSEILAI